MFQFAKGLIFDFFWKKELINYDCKSYCKQKPARLITVEDIQMGCVQNLLED